MATYRMYPMIQALKKASIPFVCVSDTAYVFDGIFWHKLPEDFDENMGEVIEELEEKINELTESRVDYEENHEDSGDNYAFLVGECYSKVPSAFTEYIKEQYPNLNLVSTKEIYERILSLDLFEMVNGSIFGPYQKRGVTIGSFPVGEVEEQIFIEDIDELNTIGERWQRHIACAWIENYSSEVCVHYCASQIPPLHARYARLTYQERQADLFCYQTIKFVPQVWHERKECDILSYEVTDAVWFAVIPFETIKDQVEEYIQDNLEDCDTIIVE